MKTIAQRKQSESGLLNIPERQRDYFYKFRSKAECLHKTEQSRLGGPKNLYDTQSPNTHIVKILKKQSPQALVNLLKY